MGGLSLLELTLNHFRSHRRARLALDGRPVAIWGPNGAGKTNILEAISLLSPGRGLRRAGADDLIRKPEGLGWKVAGLLQSNGQGHEVETWAEPGAGRQVRIDGKTAPQVMLGHISRILWLVPAMDRLWIEGAEGRRRFLDRMVMSFEPSHADHAQAYDKAMRERNHLLRENCGDTAWFAALEARMAEAGAEMIAARERTLNRIASAQNDGGAFPRADLAILAGDEELPRDTAGLIAFWADTRRRDRAAGRSLAGPHRADMVAVYSAKNVPANLCSTGEQKALLISLILANARALIADIGGPPILLLDEVAAHLDAARRGALYDEIWALGAQAFMTGTGPELFQGLEERAMGLKVTEAGGTSTLVEKPIT